MTTINRFRQPHPPAAASSARGPATAPRRFLFLPSAGATGRLPRRIAYPLLALTSATLWSGLVLAAFAMMGCSAVPVVMSEDSHGVVRLATSTVSLIVVDGGIREYPEAPRATSMFECGDAICLK